MFTTFHRTPLCMSLGHEAEQIRERPTIPSIHTEPEHSPLRRLLCLGCLRGRCSTFMAFIARGYFHPPSIVVAPVKLCCVAVKLLLTVFSSCLVLSCEWMEYGWTTYRVAYLFLNERRLLRLNSPPRVNIINNLVHYAVSGRALSLLCPHTIA